MSEGWQKALQVVDRALERVLEKRTLASGLEIAQALGARPGRGLG